LRVVLCRPVVRGAIGLVGGAALLYMGIDMLRSAATVGLALVQKEAAPWLSLLGAGAAVSLANPYFTGWWATVGVGQLAQTGPRNSREYLAFYLGHELSDYAWYSLVGVLVIAARGLLQQAWYNRLVGLCGASVALLALWFVYSGIRLIVESRRPVAAADLSRIEG
jgi:threonine/homoserine/homoserine lactone efflux protein